MANFKSWRSFLDFKEATRQGTRYVRDDKTEDFLKTVMQTVRKRVDGIAGGTLLWRAQTGYDPKPDTDRRRRKPMLPVPGIPYPHWSERMKPLRDSATEGRANPKGIPALYLATDPETAIAEVRPWKGAYVSVAMFKMSRKLRVVNCITDNTKHDYYSQIELKHRQLDLPSGEWEGYIWFHIDNAFAQPITVNDRVADYAPTQIIAELFKVHGYDGIACRSSVSNTGHNIVLFDLDVAEPVQCQLFRVHEIKFESSPVTKPVHYG